MSQGSKIPRDVYRFGEFELDRRAYRLGRKGRPIQLERRPLDCCSFLVERPGELVTRQEIRERVWGANVFLDIDSAIKTAARKLRVVLHHDPGSPHFIETIPAKGYRFIARIREARSNGQVRSRLARLQISLAGRESEMAMLHEGLGEATSGTGRLMMKEAHWNISTGTRR